MDIDGGVEGPGADLKGHAWPRGPARVKPPDVSDEKWAELKVDPDKWTQWVEEDRERFAIYYLAGEAAQLQHSPGSLIEPHKTD